MLVVGGLFFLIMLGLAFGRIGRDALFIQKVGAEGLAIIYICNALLMTLISVVYARVYDRVSRISFLIGLLLLAAAIVCTLRYLLEFDRVWLYYLLYIVTESIILLIPLHFWTFANEIFDPRQGKRIFPLLGAAGLVGTIAGGVSTGLFSDRIGTINLLLVSAAVLLLACPLALYFRLRFGRISPFGIGRADASSLRENFSSIWNIPLVRTLCYMSVPMWLTVYLIDYQFFLALEETFHSRDAMSTALGVVQGVTSGLGLIFQIFLTSRLIRLLGLGRAVMIFPFSMGLGSLGMILRLFIPAGLGSGVFGLRFIPAFFARISDEAVVYSIGDSANQLLYHSIVEEWRGHARAFISGAMEPGSIALAGLLLLAYDALEIPHFFLPFLSLLFVVPWLFFGWRIRADYTNALVGNLSSHNIDAQNHALTELAVRKDPRASRRLIASLESEDEQVGLMAVDILANSGSQSDLREMAGALDRIRLDAVKIAVLKTLARLRSGEYLERILSQLASPAPAVRAETVRTAGFLGRGGALALLEPFLDDPDAEVRAEALIVQLRERKRLDGRNRSVRELGKLIRSSRVEHRLLAAYVIREAGKRQLHGDLIRLSKSKSSQLRREVLRALGVIGDEETLPFLAGFLEDEQMVYHATEAIEMIGARKIGPLLRMIERETNETRKKHMILCLGKIGDPLAVHALASMLVDHSIEIENAALESLTQIHAKLRETNEAVNGTPLDGYFHEGVMRVAKRGMQALTLSIRKKSWALMVVEALPESDARWLLKDALLRSYGRKEKAALKYLELLAEPRAIRAAGADLRSGEERAQAEAIELIESTGPAGEHLARAIEPRYFPDDHEASPVPDANVLPLVLMEQLMSKERPWFYACLLFAVGEFKLTGMVDLVRGHASSDNPLIRGNARLALGKLQTRKKRNRTREVKKMAANMERMLFLRSVPLFSEVDGDDIFWINEITREKRYSGGEIIFRENDEGDALYIIVSGSVRIIKGEVEQITLDVLQKRDVFGEMSILDHEPRSATIETIEDTRLLVIMRDDFQRLLLARPRIAFSLFRTLSGRLRHLSGRLREVESKHEHAATGRA